MTKTNEDSMTVTQGDREAAARVYQQFRDHDYARWVREGTNATGDHDSIVQAFARHRLASQLGERSRRAEEDAAKIRALKAAKQFIENGLEMGFIRMPDASTPDTAHDTLPMIIAALGRQSGDMA